MAMYFYHLETTDDLFSPAQTLPPTHIIGISHHALLGKQSKRFFLNSARRKSQRYTGRSAKGEIGPQTFEISYRDDRFSGFYDVHVSERAP